MNKRTFEKDLVVEYEKKERTNMRIRDGHILTSETLDALMSGSVDLSRT